jgi:hypothetical protein
VSGRAKGRGRERTKVSFDWIQSASPKVLPFSQVSFPPAAFVASSNSRS